MAICEDELKAEALALHERNQGKLGIAVKALVRDMHDLARAYSPGVAEPCRRIHADRNEVYRYTAKGNLVAVVSDGTAVLGLGAIGPEAAIPVMEGKAVLLKTFAGVDGFPICLATGSVDEIVNAVRWMAPVFGGVNLEDIAAPRCFEIEDRLREELQIPVFHDDQHGTAIVVAAGVINALKVVGKSFKALRVVVNGAGAAGIAVSRMLLDLGVEDLILCDSKGTLPRPGDMNRYKAEIAARTNPRGVSGGLAEALVGADVVIGLSQAGAISPAMVRSMADRPIVFALANPDPEILPPDAFAAGAAVVGTGRSDYPNQVNNVLAFPGVFRGALDVRATCINEAMKQAAAFAIAGLVTPEELSRGVVIPNSFNPQVAPAVAAAVAQAAMRTGVSRVQVNPDAVAENCRRLRLLGGTEVR
jgi:malate dehydrogenase (oxaloacetate-decarboxylating)